MLISKPQRLTARLPATPCTPEMRERIAQIADQEKVTMADVQRNAFGFFLAQIDSKAVSIDSKIGIQMEIQAS
ncbi:MAG: hypothetical protein K8L97_25185 [Anaerolineae bacterium]|nr:hypothetical protein [Anaerolineae bacterium]